MHSTCTYWRVKTRDELTGDDWLRQRSVLEIVHPAHLILADDLELHLVALELQACQRLRDVDLRAHLTECVPRAVYVQEASVQDGLALRKCRLNNTTLSQLPRRSNNDEDLGRDLPR
eukprot:1457005-Pleurochrysis_carterae.AAC.2